MAEGPERLEVENQCPTVSHNNVSRKHNTDLQYTSGKSWHFIANFNPEDISHHHSLEDYQRLFLTQDERISLSYLVIQIKSTSFVSDSMEWEIEGEQSTAVKISAMKPAAMLDVEIRCTARVRMSAAPTWTQRVSEHPDSPPRGMRSAETKKRFNRVLL